MANSTSVESVPAAPGIDRLLLKLNEAALYLSISPRSLWGAAKAGRIPVVRIGRCMRFDIRDLNSFADANKTTGGRP